MPLSNRTRTPLRLATLLLAGALAACSDAPTGAPSDPESLLARQVAALGFRADMIEDHGDFVLVEGDIYLSKAHLRTVPLVDPDDPMRPKFQYRSNNLVSMYKVFDIRVDLSGLASEPGWEAAARDALTHWTGIGSYVRLVEGGPADITLSTTCISPSVAAFASFPSGSNPGSTIHVNSCFGYTTSHAQKVHNMVHEFGHTLGFRHSNWNQIDCDAYGGDPATCNWNGGTTGAVHIPGTPTSGNASGSVMNGGTALNSWAGFSNSDRTATHALYPLPTPNGLTSSHPFGTVVLTWNPVAGAAYYQVRQMELYREQNYYENWSQEYLTEGLWVNVFDSTYDTGGTWTGISQCVWRQSSYDEQVTTYWVELRAVYPNGTSGITSLSAEYASC